MKALTVCLFFLPLPLIAQTDSLLRSTSSQSPIAPKLIEFREVPYTYSTKGGVQTGTHQIYTYDGIDVDKPQRELWQYMDALNDADVAYQHHQFDSLQAQQVRKKSLGLTLAIVGGTAFVVGAIQAIGYDNALHDQQLLTPKITKLDRSDGRILGLSGVFMGLMGLLSTVPNRQKSDATFLRAVQYYNRAVKQKFSWQVGPWWPVNGICLRLVAHF